MVTVIRAWRTAGLLLSPLPPLSMSSSLLPASPSSAWQRKGDQEGGKEKDDHEAAIPRDHPWLWGKCPPKPLGSATSEPVILEFSPSTSAPILSSPCSSL